MNRSARAALKFMQRAQMDVSSGAGGLETLLRGVSPKPLRDVSELSQHSERASWQHDSDRLAVSRHLQTISILALMLMFLLSRQTNAHEVNVHERLSRRASECAARMNETLFELRLMRESLLPKSDFKKRIEQADWADLIGDETKKHIVDITAPLWSSEGTTGTPHDLIRLGSILEDVGRNPLNHFYKPVSHTTGVAIHDPSSGIHGALVSAQQWILGHSTDHGAWSRALDDYYSSLTTADQNKHDSLLAETFIALGRAIHLVQDMTSPAHVRNDGHMCKSWIPLPAASCDPLEYVGMLVTSSSDKEKSDKFSQIIQRPRSTVEIEDPCATITSTANFVARNFFSEGTRGESSEIGFAPLTYVDGSRLPDAPGEYVSEATSGDYIFNDELHIPVLRLGTPFATDPDEDEFGTVLLRRTTVNDPTVLTVYATVLYDTAVVASARVLNYFFRINLEAEIFWGSEDGKSDVQLRLKNSSPACGVPQQLSILPTAENLELYFYSQSTGIKTLKRAEIIQPDENAEWLNAGESWICRAALGLTEAERATMTGPVVFRVVYNGTTAAEGEKGTERVVSVCESTVDLPTQLITTVTPNETRVFPSASTTETRDPQEGKLVYAIQVTPNSNQTIEPVQQNPSFGLVSTDGAAGLDLTQGDLGGTLVLRRSVTCEQKTLTEGAPGQQWSVLPVAPPKGGATPIPSVAGSITIGIRARKDRVLRLRISSSELSGTVVLSSSDASALSSSSGSIAACELNKGGGQLDWTIVHDNYHDLTSLASADCQHHEDSDLPQLTLANTCGSRWLTEVDKPPIETSTTMTNTASNNSSESDTPAQQSWTSYPQPETPYWEEQSTTTTTPDITDGSKLATDELRSQLDNTVLSHSYAFEMEAVNAKIADARRKLEPILQKQVDALLETDETKQSLGLWELMGETYLAFHSKELGDRIGAIMKGSTAQDGSETESPLGAAPEVDDNGLALVSGSTAERLPNTDYFLYMQIDVSVPGADGSGVISWRIWEESETK